MSKRRGDGLDGFPSIEGLIGGGDKLTHTIGTHDQRDVIQHEKVRAHVARQRVRLVAQIFGRPTSPAMKGILDDNEYLHLRSADRVNFYFPGYADDGKPPSAASFRVREFVQAVTELEALTTWKYGEETDLVLLNSVHDLDANTSELAYDGVVHVRLERALADKAIPSVAVLLGEIMRFADAFRGDDPAWGFSDDEGKKVIGEALSKLLYSLAPKWLEGHVNKAKHFVVKDVSKK